jgi:hypothetical protein
VVNGIGDCGGNSDEEQDGVVNPFDVRGIGELPIALLGWLDPVERRPFDVDNSFGPLDPIFHRLDKVSAARDYLCVRLRGCRDLSEGVPHFQAQSRPKSIVPACGIAPF